jgi:glycosyltransferase involved in cell wall biosynthesis
MSTLWTGNNHHFEWCDIVIGQLMGDSYAHNKSGQYNKPYVFIAHNPYTSYFIRWSKRPYIIYNAENTRKETAHEYGNIPGIVLHPFVKPQPKPRGAAVTLVNCNENKGGGVLVELAKIFPHRRFIGVLGGYGEQVTADLPNITYLPNGTEMDAVWKQTGTCIVPSTIESYSQAALEAISYGIPVICSDLPGLRENLGDAGIYIKDNNVPLYVKAIEGKKPDVTGRANELYQQSIIELEQVNEWLLNIVK